MYFHLATGTTTKPTIAEVATTTTQETLQKEIDGLAKQYGVNAELATRIIKCESHNNPNAIGYNAHSEDIGLFELNTKYQEPTAIKMGYDIYVPYQNLEYGMWLLSTSGSQPWAWSKKCWSLTS